MKGIYLELTSSTVTLWIRDLFLLIFYYKASAGKHVTTEVKLPCRR